MNLIGAERIKLLERKSRELRQKNGIVLKASARSAKTGFDPDALQQALYKRRPDGDGSLVHHGDRGQPRRIQLPRGQGL